VSPAAYDQGHIEGAVLWNVYRDLKDDDYVLADKAAFQLLLSRSGITPGSTVVFYGYAATMGFWLMKLYGHVDVRILDVGRAVWAQQGRPWTTEVGTPVTTRCLLPDPDTGIRADHRAVQAAIGDPATTIVDVRSAAEFAGERFWPSGGLEEGGRAGHVPSAIHVPLDEVLDAHGSFQDRAVLHRLFADVEDAGPLISYCAIGGRACTAWFALTYLLGRDDVRVYDGSWAEWGRMAAMPVECARPADVA
jgi:thiosulfate/3-mercaptopyruvate sulfurtransferase